MAALATDAEFTPEALEPGRFRIDSAGWAEKTDPKGVRYLENPEGDAWELQDGPFAGEQFFTYESAVRETAKAGKRMPTKDEWEVVTEAGTFVPTFAGSWNWNRGRYYDQGTNASYWSSSPNGGVAYNAHFLSNGVSITTNSLRANGFSVLCVRNS